MRGNPEPETSLHYSLSTSSILPYPYGMDEFSRIARYFAPLAGEGAFGLGDDAALLIPPAGTRLVTTTDSVIAGVHCLGDESADMLAHKLMRRNLSDLAAMGAEPYAYLVSLMLPHGTGDVWFADFARGLAECQDMFGCVLLGGDTAATPGPLTLSLTAFGTLTGLPLLRSGAQVGDALYVTGTLGDAALGLDILQEHLACADAKHLLQRYYTPEPRLRIGQNLHGLAHSCMDISDGLVQDAAHMATASGVSFVIDTDILPLSAPAQRVIEQMPALLHRIVSGGDDYELLFTAPASSQAALEAIAAQTGIPFTCIGEVCEGSGVTLLRQGVELALHEQGYRHF